MSEIKACDGCPFAGDVACIDGQRPVDVIIFSEGIDVEYVALDLVDTNDGSKRTGEVTVFHYGDTSSDVADEAAGNVLGAIERCAAPVKGYTPFLFLGRRAMTACGAFSKVLPNGRVVLKGGVKEVTAPN